MADFDLVASSLRADATDTAGLAHALARRLETALPQQTRVQRRSKGLLSRTKVVRRIEVDLGEARYSLAIDDRGGAEAYRAHEVRGIVVKNEPLGVDAWLDALAQRGSGATEVRHHALARLLHFATNLARAGQVFIDGSEVRSPVVHLAGSLPSTRSRSISPAYVRA